MSLKNKFTLKKIDSAMIRKSRIDSNETQATAKVEKSTGKERSHSGIRNRISSLHKLNSFQHLRTFQKQEVSFDSASSNIVSETERKHQPKEYLFLKDDSKVQQDPFLKAKMKHLLKKENLKQTQSQSCLTNLYKRYPNGEDGKFTTLKKEKQKQSAQNINLLKKFKEEKAKQCKD